MSHTNRCAGGVAFVFVLLASEFPKPHLEKMGRTRTDGRTEDNPFANADDGGKK